MISAGITPTDNIDNNTQKDAIMTFQNANTQASMLVEQIFITAILVIMMLVYR